MCNLHFESFSFELTELGMNNLDLRRVYFPLW